MNAVLANWKTTLMGIVAGVTVFIGQAYKPNMTAKQWGVAILSGLSTTLLGAFAHDGYTPKP